MKTVAVIGAGITGLLAAYYLVRDGHQVTVFEQESAPAMQTSFANGGQVSVSNSEVWTTWSNVKKGIKWTFTKDAPLLVRPTFELRKFSWLAQFLWHTIKNEYSENTNKTIQLGMESRELYKQLIAEEGLEFDQLYAGILHFYKDGDYLQHAMDAAAIYEKNNCDWEILTEGKLKSLDPALSDITGILGGAWTSTDWTGDIHKFCTQLATILKEKYHVKFTYNFKISRVEYIEYEYDAIVVSAGVGSVAVAKRFGDSLPIYPVKGYSITINVKDSELQYLPKVSLLDDQAKIVTSTLGTRFRVAGTAELDGENYDIRPDRIQPLLNWVHINFPKISTDDYSSWACLRPMTPNMMPIVRQSKNISNIFYHTGHGHLGWTLSPATAKQLIELISK